LSLGRPQPSEAKVANEPLSVIKAKFPGSPFKQAIHENTCSYALFSGAFVAAQSQTTIDRDPEIAGMVKEVNADSLQSYIKTMVSFGTRSTVSSTTDRLRGIGAARNWVLMKFREFAVASGGRMTALLDTTTYPADGRRVKSDIEPWAMWWRH
jgi:hypothetical protein